MENETGGTSGTGAGGGDKDAGGRRDPMRDLQARVEAALDEVRPKIRKALEELDSKVDAAVDDIRPRAQNAMREVQPKVDQFVADIQPRLDSLLEKLQAKLNELRRDLDERATRASGGSSRGGNAGELGTGGNQPGPAEAGPDGSP